MRFLCETHRQQLLQDVNQVLSHWHEWMRQGDSFLQAEQWADAFRVLGCSFEAAEWLLFDCQTEQQDFSHLKHFITAGHRLAGCCRRSGRTDLELHFLLSIHYRLIDLAKSSASEYYPLSLNLQESIQRLKQHSHQHGAFEGYPDCVAETATYQKSLRRHLH